MQITGASSAPAVIPKKISLQSRNRVTLKSTPVYFVSDTPGISSPDNAASSSLLRGWWCGPKPSCPPGLSCPHRPLHPPGTHILAPPHGNRAPGAGGEANGLPHSHSGPQSSQQPLLLLAPPLSLPGPRSAPPRPARPSSSPAHRIGRPGHRGAVQPLTRRRAHSHGRPRSPARAQGSRRARPS